MSTDQEPPKRDGKYPPTETIRAIVDKNHQRLAQKVTREIATSPSGAEAKSQSWYHRLWNYVARLGRAQKQSP